MYKRLPIKTLFWFLFTTFALWNISPSTGKSLTKAEQDYTFVALDSLEAEYHAANKVVVVKGSIKNVSKIVLRGYISLHILSSSGTKLYTTEMPVKKNQPILSGESVAFDTVLNVSNVSGAAQISADFTWD